MGERLEAERRAGVAPGAAEAARVHVAYAQVSVSVSIPEALRMNPPNPKTLTIY